MRALIDASVLLRYPLPSRNPARAVDLIVAAAVARTFALLVPSDLLDEMAEKLESDPYLSTRVSLLRVDVLTGLLRHRAIPLSPYPGPFPPRTRDPKDDYLLAYALRDRADYLVTGDRDLLVLAPDFPAPRIVDPGAFVRELRARGLLAR